PVGAAQSRGRSGTVVVGQEPSEPSARAAAWGAQYACDLGSVEGDPVGAEPHRRIQAASLDVALHPVRVVQHRLAEQERFLAGAGAREPRTQMGIEVDHVVLVHVIDPGETPGGPYSAGRDILSGGGLEYRVVRQVRVLEQVVRHIDAE